MVRATLRLLFDGATADRIAVRDGSRLDRLARRSIRQWTLERWIGRISRRIHAEELPPLGPHAHLPARGAVALALQVGLGVDGETLATATATSASQIGHDLFRARQATLGSGVAACGEFTSAIGRYRDPSLEMTERATLIRHAQNCEACRHTIERFQSIDARLFDRVEWTASTLPVEPEIMAKDGRRLPGVVVAALLFVVAVIAVTGVLLDRGRQTPAAILATPAAQTNSLSGWLLRQDINGAVTAINLQTGLQQPIGPQQTEPANLQYGNGTAILSPNRHLIARQEPVGQPNSHSQLTIFTVDGDLLQTVDFEQRLNVHLNGWLGNDTVLEVIEPFGGINQPFNDYVTGLQQDSTVVAVNVLTGKQREIFRGSVAAVFPSPDQSLVAIRTWDDASGRPAVMELRPLAGGAIGDPIARITLGDSGDPVWAPDSSHFYAAFNPASVEPAPTTSDATPTPGVVPITDLRTVSIDRSGRMTGIPPLPGGQPNYPLSVSPDDRVLFRASVAQGDSDTLTQYRLWRTDLASGDATPLTSSEPSMLQSGTWSPDGETFMFEGWRPFLITASVDNSALGDVWTTSISAIFPNGRMQRVRSQLGDQFYSGLVGWLPASALHDQTAVQSGGQPGEAKTVDAGQPQSVLDGSSSASPDGSYVVLHDDPGNVPVIWNRSARSARRLPPGTTDLSWLPQSDMLIGVGRVGTGQQSNLSRLMTFAPQFNGAVPYFDFRSYDPAGIGTSRTVHYASPRFSPDEGTLAFFVVDSSHGSVNLWLADYGRAPRAVHSWSIPPDDKLDSAPVAAWMDNRTLIFAEPGDWKDGLPSQTQLEQLTLNSGGASTVSALTTLRTHGNELGIELCELAINQRSGAIAYRLRHYTRSSADSGFFDSVAVANLAHIDSPIELSREGSGTGLDWSPGGQVLTAAFPGQIRFYSTTGELLGTVNGQTDAAAPIWVSPSQVWFTARRDGGDRVIEVGTR